MLQDGATDLKKLNEQFLNAVGKGDIQKVELFLANGDINPAASDNYALCLAAPKGHTEVVKLLLADSRINPAAANNCALRLAAQYGRLGVVKLLLVDPRVDPAADHNYAFHMAAREGQAEVLKLLLADPRVDPAADNNIGFRWAAREGRAEVIKLLLADPRVDPAADNNYALRIAAKNGNLEVIILLMSHPAVMTYIRENLINFIRDYPALQNALTSTHADYNPAFCKDFLSLIGKEFLSKSRYYIAALQANGMPNDLITLHIAPLLDPLFDFYKERIMDDNKSYDSINLVNQSCQLLPIYKTKRQDEGIDEELMFRTLKKPRLECNEMEVIEDSRMKM